MRRAPVRRVVSAMDMSHTKKPGEWRAPQGNEGRMRESPTSASTSTSATATATTNTTDDGSTNDAPARVRKGGGRALDSRRPNWNATAFAHALSALTPTFHAAAPP